MRGFNTVCLMGHLGQDPRVKTTTTGQTVCEFSLATNRRFKRGDEWVEETDWHDVAVWNGQAEIASRFLRKGDPVAIEGTLRTDTWTDAHDQKRKKVSVVGHRVHLIGGSRRRDSAPAEAPPPVTAAPLGSEDGIPF